MTPTPLRTIGIGVIISVLVFAPFSFLVLHAFAVSDTFTVSATIGADTTAPSAPTNLSATPVATSQIDLSWTASTDDILLSGYQVFRDGVQIATTTLTTYSDTGLSASTLYTYYINAFDSSNNVSSSSASVATTTLAVAAVAEEETGGASGGGSPALDIRSLEVTPGTYSALLTWRTTAYARSTLRYGRTMSYEIGTIAEHAFSLSHTAYMSNLTPNTRYYFSINGETGTGFEKELVASYFVTLPLPDTAPPANATDFTAEKVDEDIQLTWSNPLDVDFSHVRILRSDRFYPSDLTDGALIYEGDDEAFLDKGSAIPGTTQYFTLFAYDENGNISSGAVTALRIGADGTVTSVDVSDVPVAPGEEEIDISLSDLIFEQEGKVLEPVDGTVAIDGSKELTVSLPLDVLAERLKSIVVTVYKGGTEEKFSFLLRVDEERDRYVASVAPLRTSGRFPILVSVFDYGIQKVGEARGVLAARTEASGTGGGGPDYFLYFLAFLLLLLFVAGFLIGRAWRRRSV